MCRFLLQFYSPCPEPASPQQPCSTLIFGITVQASVSQQDCKSYCVKTVFSSPHISQPVYTGQGLATVMAVKLGYIRTGGNKMHMTGWTLRGSNSIFIERALANCSLLWSTKRGGLGTKFHDHVIRNWGAQVTQNTRAKSAKCRTMKQNGNWSQSTGFIQNTASGAHFVGGNVFTSWYVIWGPHGG
jgi:hypothetical protein